MSIEGNHQQIQTRETHTDRAILCVQRPSVARTRRLYLSEKLAN